MLYDYTLYSLEVLLEIFLTTLYALTGSYFWSLILLSVLVRFLTKPLEKLTQSSVVFQAEIEAVLQPQIAIIRNKLSGSERHAAISRLYERYGYHPVHSVRSVFGLLIQLPLFIAAYYMLSDFSEMRGEEIPVFGNLGTPDSLLPGGLHLAPFIMIAANLAAVVTVRGATAKNKVQGLVIALLFFVLLYEAPLGLIIYWTSSNLFSLFSNFAWLFRRRLPKSNIRLPVSFDATRRTLKEYGYLFFVTNLAILFPLLGVLGEQFNFFTAHGLTAKTIIAVLFLIMCVPSAILAMFRYLCKKNEKVEAFDFLVLVIFVGAFFTYSLNKAGYGVFETRFEPLILFFIAMLVTLGAVWVIVKSRLLRSLSYFSVLVPVVFLHFVFVSPASTLFNRSDVLLSASPRSMNETPVFVLVFDEFSGLTIQDADGNLDNDRYPNFGELADRADYFPNALTTGYHTDIAVPSIVSGTVRAAENKGLAPGENLIELFNVWGGGTTAQSPILPANILTEREVDLSSLSSDVATLYLHLIFHKDWIEEKIGAIPSSWKGFGIFGNPEPATINDEATNQVRQPERFQLYSDWIADLSEDSNQSQLNFHHIVYPHVPYSTTASGRHQKNSELIRQQLVTIEEFRANQSFLNVGYHNYLQQTAYADVLLGDLIDTLKERALFDKSLIIITADHGVSYLKEGLSRRDPFTPDAWKNIMSVPLLVKHPRQERGRTISSFVTTLDIVPTVLESVDLPQPWEMPGQDLSSTEGQGVSSSVELVPGYAEFFSGIEPLFEQSRARKHQLFGGRSPIAALAVNYTETPAFSSLLNSSLEDFSIGSLSDHHAIWEGDSGSAELSRLGKVYKGSIPQNDVVLAALVNNRVQAVFSSGDVQNESGKFAFSLPEPANAPDNLAISLYEVIGTEQPSLRLIQAFSPGELTFLSKTAIDYDWSQSVESSNGLDQLLVETGKIHTVSSDSIDPFLVMQPFTAEPVSEPTIRIDLTSNKALLLQVFYQTANEPGFAEERSKTIPVNRGDNVLYIDIPSAISAGEFRIDLGLGGPTEVEISKIEIRH